MKKSGVYSVVINKNRHDKNIIVLYMPVVENIQLYNKVKQEADKIYKKPTAYKSGWIVKTYK
jgi:hypothetical protein